MKAALDELRPTLPEEGGEDVEASVREAPQNTERRVGSNKETPGGGSDCINFNECAQKDATPLSLLNPSLTLLPPTLEDLLHPRMLWIVGLTLCIVRHPLSPCVCSLTRPRHGVWAM